MRNYPTLHLDTN